MAFAAYFAWGLLAPVGKILLEDLQPMSLNAVRMVLATAMLIPLVPRHLVREGIAYLRRPHIVILALIGGGIDFTIYLYALDLVDATFAALGFYTAPLWTAVLARLWLGERVGWSFGPAVATLLIGGWLALFGLDAAPVEGFHAWGMVLAVLSGAGWAVYSAGLRRWAPELRLRPLLVASFIVGTVYFVVLGWILEGPPPLRALGAAQWGWLLLYAAVPTTLSMFLFNAALQRAPAGYVNLLVGLELAGTVFFSWWLLGDTFSLAQLVGLALALLAVTAYLAERARPQQITPG